MNEETTPLEIQTTERAAPQATGELAPYKGRRKVRVGVVVSDKMDKTVVVAVMRSYRHPVYRKTIRRTKKYMAHDEQNACRVGDRVEIVETRPLSRHKRWRVRQILERAQ
ncbi:MAG: 30S ribosomal protein S17 [Fimbriimonadales bacterium]